MAIPASPNSVSFSQIQTEMGGSNPISLSEYYSGGSLVKANLGIFAPNGVPSSGQISVNDFRGAENTSEEWTTQVDFTRTTTPFAGHTIKGHSTQQGPVGGSPVNLISDNTPDNGRVMKSSTLSDLCYIQISASKGSPPNPFDFQVIINPSGAGPGVNMNNNTDAFKTVTDPGASTTYQRSAATHTDVGGLRKWLWPNSPHHETQNVDVKFDCN